MTFNEYQNKAMSTAIYPNVGSNYIYPSFEIAGEAGEIAGKIGKIIRDQNGAMNLGDSVALAKELGDVLWGVAALAYEIGYSLEDIAQINVNKLKNRQEKGTLSGSGDDR